MRGAWFACSELPAGRGRLTDGRLSDRLAAPCRSTWSTTSPALSPRAAWRSSSTCSARSRSPRTRSRAARRPIVPIADVDDARELKRQHPDWLLIGERHARPLPGFDCGNSPTDLEQLDVAGRTLIHTTHSGTQGLTAACRPTKCITGALVNAGAIVRYIQARAARGRDARAHGAPGRARTATKTTCAPSCCARGSPASRCRSPAFASACAGAASAQKFFDPACDWAPQRDFELCTRVDAFDFVLQLERARASAPRACARSTSAGAAMNPIVRTIVLLTLSNVFMTFAWYAHLKHLNQKPWIVAALVSWGIALFEYLLQVPANRIGYTVMTLPQLKILQEVITLTVFVPFVMLYMRQPLKLDYLWAALCMLGAVYFVFRNEHDDRASIALVESCRRGDDPTVDRAPAFGLGGDGPAASAGRLLPAAAGSGRAASERARARRSATCSCRTSACWATRCCAATGALRINYAIFGNVEPALHAHVHPRYADEPEAMRTTNPWGYDWQQAPAFDAQCMRRCVT